MKFKITSLRVKDTGPFKDVFIDFLSENKKPLDICLIAGPNGSGKTTILKLILGLIAQLSRCPHHQPNIKKEIGYAQLNLLVDEIPFTIYYGKKPGDAKIIENNYLGYERQAKSQKYRRKSKGELIPTLHLLTHMEEHEEVNCPDLDKFDATGKHLPVVLFFPHTREIEPLKGRSQIYKEETHFELVYEYKNVRQFQGSFESYLIWLDYAEQKNYKQIIKFLNDLNLDGKRFVIDRKNLVVNVKTKNGALHPLNELSSGEQNLLILLTELRRRLDRYGIVLIDEIENSLHPEYQFKLMEHLKKLQDKIDIQIIITSHSIDVYDHLKAENIRIINPLLK